MLNTLLSSFCSIICQVVAYERLKTKENFKLLTFKVVAVTYERWLLTRGSRYSNFDVETFGILETWLLTTGGRNQSLTVYGMG